MTAAGQERRHSLARGRPARQRPPSGDRAHRPPARPGRIVIRLAAAGLVVLLVAAAAVAFDARRTGMDAEVETAHQIATLAARTVVEPRLAHPLLASEPSRLAATLDTTIRQTVLGDSLVRVKLLTRTGRVVYSDESRLIGATFPLEPYQWAVLHTQQTRSAMTDPDSAENEFELGQPDLLEVYVPVRDDAGEPLLFEAYFRDDEARSIGAAVWRRFLVPVLAALLVLQLVHLPVAWCLARSRRRDRNMLTLRAVDAAAVERRRLAGDLHDGVVPELTGLGYELDAIGRAGPAPPDVHTALTQAAARIRGAVEALRSLLIELYPPEVTRVGLPESLRQVAATTRQPGLDIRVDVDELDQVPMAAAAVLFRVAQEAIRNVVAHSGATRVVVLGRSDCSVATLVVTDNGLGFDPTVPGPEVGHLGLRIIHDLVSSVDGQVAVRSAPGVGTTVDVEVPLA